MSGTRGLLEAAEAAAVVLNRCGKVLNLPASLRLPLPNLNDEVLRTKPVLVEEEPFEVKAEAAAVEVEAEAEEVFSAS